MCLHVAKYAWSSRTSWYTIAITIAAESVEFEVNAIFGPVARFGGTRCRGNAAQDKGGFVPARIMQTASGVSRSGRLTVPASRPGRIVSGQPAIQPRCRRVQLFRGRRFSPRSRRAAQFR